jgi:hypothetical protein
VKPWWVEAPWVNRRFTGSPRRGPWGLNFFEGLYMYIYTDDATRLDPPHPCSFVHYCSFAHYCTLVHCCWVAGRCLRERVFSFVRQWCIHLAIIQPALNHSAKVYSAKVYSTGYWVAYSGMLWRVKVFELFSSIYLTAFVLVYSK